MYGVPKIMVEFDSYLRTHKRLLMLGPWLGPWRLARVGWVGAFLFPFSFTTATSNTAIHLKKTEKETNLKRSSCLESRQLTFASWWLTFWIRFVSSVSSFGASHCPWASRPELALILLCLAVGVNDCYATMLRKYVWCAENNSGI